jgi:iron complex outermembrane receptor protein
MTPPRLLSLICALALAGFLLQPTLSSGQEVAESSSSAAVRELDRTVVEATVPPPRPVVRPTPVPVVVEAPAPVIDDEAPALVVENYGAFAPRTTTTLGLPLDLRRLPASVSTVSEEFIESSQTNRLRDALIYIPGVTVNDDGGWTTDGILVRGFAADRYYNDGLKQVGLSIRPHFDTIERIEVLKGPAGAEFGVAEPGGLINIIRKKPFEGRLYEIDSSVGSYGFQNHTIDFNDTLNADGSLQGRLVAAYGESAEWRLGRRDHDDIYNYVVAPSINWDYSDQGSLTFSFERQVQSDPQDRGIIFLQGAFPGGFAPRDWSWHQNSGEQINDQNRFRVDWRHDLNDALTVRTTYEFLDYSYRVREYRNADSEFFPGFPGPYNPDGLTWNGARTFPAYFDIWAADHDVHNFQIELDYDFDLAGTKNTAVVGFRVFSMTNAGRFESPTITGNTSVNLFNPDPNGLSTNVTALGAPFFDANREEELGYFLRLHTELTPRLRTLFSTQFIDYDTLMFGSRSASRTLSVRAAVSYDLTDIHTAFFGFSNAFAPQAGGTRSGDPLDPTSDQSFELGLKTELFGGRALWTNSVFHTNRSDIVAADPTNRPTEFFSINFGEVEISGFESEFVGRVTDELTFRGGFAFLDSEIVQTDLGPFAGNPFANAADFQLSGFADYNLALLGLPKLTVSAGLVHVADRPGNSAGTVILPDYTVFDLGLRCDLDENTELYAFASNLFDETYYLSMQDSGARADQIDVGDRQLFRFGARRRF